MTLKLAAFVSDTSRQFWYNYTMTNQWEIERK